MPVPAGLLFGLGALGTAVGAGVSAHNASQTNKLNYKLLKEQQEFAKDMWHLQNLYNSPYAQRQRLEQAGINPALALGNITTGIAQSVQTPSAAPAVGHDAGNILANGIQQGANTLLSAQTAQNQKALIDAQVLKTNVESAGLAIDNKFKTREKQALLDQVQANIESMRTNSDLNRFNLDFLRKSEPDQLRAIAEDVNVKISQQAVNNSVAALNDDTLRNMRPLERQHLRAQIANVYQSTLYLVQQGQVAAAQVDSLVQGVLESQARAGLIDVQAGQIKTLLQPTLKSLNAQANLYGEQAQTLGKQRSYMGQDNARQWISTITGGFRDIGIGVGSITGAADKAGMFGKAMAPIGFVGTR